MAATLLALSCPNCGGVLELTSRADLFKCAHCAKLALLFWPEQGAPSATAVEARREWEANLLRPGSTLNWQGGALRLTTRELVFVPGAVNFGPIEHAVLKLGDIKSISLTKGLVSDDVFVLDVSGATWGVRVRDGAALRDDLESARTKLNAPG